MAAGSSNPMAEYAEHLLKAVDEGAGKVPLLHQIERKYKVPKKYVVLGGGILFAILVWMDVFTKFISSVVGLGYPAFASFKALESKSFNDDTQWLTYWVVFAVFTFIENFSYVILHYVPFYYKLKVVALIMFQWKDGPASSGKLYKQYIKPFMSKYVKKVDAAADTTAKAVNAGRAEMQKSK